jgi:hypothetical protein
MFVLIEQLSEMFEYIKFTCGYTTQLFFLNKIIMEKATHNFINWIRQNLCFEQCYQDFVIILFNVVRSKNRGKIQLIFN